MERLIRFFLVVVGLVLSMGVPAAAQTIVFEENFDSAPIGDFAMSGGMVGIGQFTGTTDFGGIIFVRGTPDSTPVSGSPDHYVQLDHATLTSNPFSLATGTYTLSFDVLPFNFPPPLNIQTINVGLGSAYGAAMSVTSGTVSHTFSINAATAGALRFSSDRARLNNIRLTFNGTGTGSVVPEPVSVFLLLPGLAAVGLLGRRRSVSSG